MAAWWRSSGQPHGFRLNLVLAWDGDTLVALAALITRRFRGMRVLEWAAKDCSDYCDGLVDPDFSDRSRALETIWAAVAASGGFDIAYLSHVRPDAIMSTLLRSRQKGVRLKPSSRSARSMQVECDKPDGHAWFRSLSKKARNNHTRGLRIVGETGPVTIRVSEPGDSVDAVIERMIELKLRWLVDTGQSNQILSNDATILRALMRELVQQRAVRVFSIHCGDMLVAGSVNIMSGSRMQAFFAAYDPRFDRASPGTLVMVEYLMWAFDRKIPEVDFLCGEEEYKLKFANKYIDLVSFVGAKTLLGKLALAFSERLERKRATEAEVELALPGRAVEA